MSMQAATGRHGTAVGRRQGARGMGKALTAVLVGWSVGVCTAAEVLFRASFEDRLEADLARGTAVAQFEAGSDKAAGPVFADGIKGRALDSGSGCRVLYKAEGNVRNERGTLAFWSRRIGPQPEGRYTYHLAGWVNADGSWVYAYRWEWYATVHLLHGRGGSGDIGLGVPADGDDGEWHFYVFTWDGSKVRGYIDGRTDSAAARDDFPAPQFTTFWVGGGDRVSRLIDEFTVYDDVLGIAEIKALYRELGGLRNTPELIVPPRTATVKIDGRITPEEWNGAAQTTGFVVVDTSQFAPTQTRVALQYDEAALYLALSSDLPEQARQNPAMTTGMTGALAQTRDRFDTDVDHDDSMEIDVQPELPDGLWYRLVVNGLNTHYDYSVSATNNIALGWNPEWESASTLDAEGWHVEVRLPFSGFGVAPPRPGVAWGLNLLRLWSALQSGREAWAVAPRSTPGYRYVVTPVRFGDAATPVVRLGSWGPLSDNLLAVAGEVMNPTKDTLKVRARLTSDSGEVEREQALDIAPAASARFAFDGRLQDPATSLLTLTVEDDAGKTVLFRSQAPVAVRQMLEIGAAHYPSTGQLRIMIDAGRLRDTPLRDLAATVTVQDAAGQPVLPPHTVSPLPGHACDVLIDVGPVPVGKYGVHCRIEKQGAVVAERTLPFEKQAPPEWVHTTIGITDRAPKPFLPVTRAGDTLACWGREYRYGGRLLPTQIVTQGGEILAAPIELVLVDGAGRRFSSADVAAQVTWGKATDFRVEFERTVELGGVPVHLTCWLECDGFLWTILRLPPDAPTINELTVRVPLKKAWSEYINSFDYSTMSTGKLKASGYRGGENPVWLGNPVGGLQWTTETLARCRLAEGRTPVQVVPGEAMTVFELTLIGRPTTPTAGFEAAWGWTATPVRPPTPGYRGWFTDNCDISPGYQWYWPKGTDFDPRWLNYSRFVGEADRPDGRGKRLGSAGPYLVTGLCALAVPEFAYWGDEWSPSRTGRRTAGGLGVCSVAAASWRDYLLWCYRKTYDRGRFVGLYYDCAPYTPDDNLYHGGGIEVDGKVLTTNPVLAAREIAQRMYCMLRELEPERTMILYHNSGQIDMAYLSWCDVYVDGENFTSRLTKAEPDYHRLFPPDAFLAQSMGHNFGPTVYFLDEFTRSGAVAKEDWGRLGTQPCDHLYGLILLHDSTYWRAYGIGYERINEVLRRYHYDERYRFIPYWNQQVVALPENVFASFFKDDASGITLMVLLNNNETDLALRLPLKWPELGYAGGQQITVDDAVFHGDVRLENGELITPVGRANMRLLVLSGPGR
jgi:hypothetical protein